MDLLGDAVEEFHLARDKTALAGGQELGQGIAACVEIDQQEFDPSIADMDAVGAALPARRHVLADLDFDCQRGRRHDITDRGAQSPVDAGMRKQVKEGPWAA